MLTRKSPFVQGENDRTIMQDGFSAPVESVPRPRFSSACAMVGRRVMDFSDNGDGTLTAVRCVDRQADDLDIQFEAGACPVVAIAPLIVGKALDNYNLAIGGTSVIIVVGVALETVQALESQMLMRQYKGFLE